MIESVFSYKDPLKLFQNWLEEARTKAPFSVETEALAMTLSTVDPTGQPTSRVVLIKEVTPKGLIFYTNYDSKKGVDMASNSNVSLNFHWPFLGKQVQFLGTAEKTSRETSEKYWVTRPRDSQISQSISRQSEPLERDQSLEKKYAEYAKSFEGKDIPCPKNWGGYLVTPHQIQFWIAKQNRLHERVQFEMIKDQWQSVQLQP